MITTLRRAALSLVAVGGLLLTGVPSGLAQEGPAISMMDDKGIMLSASEPLFIDGDYLWGVDMYVPFDPIGTTDPPVAAVPVSVTWDFGDGTTPTVVSTTDTGDFPVWCDNSGPTYRCSVWVAHDYAAPGIYRITATAHQDGAVDGMLEAGQAMYDLDASGSVRGGGTVWAETGGMYDQDFEPAGGGTMSFSINAKRRAGTGATTGTLVVSVPSMIADSATHPTGMTFTSRTPTLPLMVKATESGGREVLLDRVYGIVTNSAGRTSSALASFHAILTPGQPTLIRISVWNTSAGYTFADTSISPSPTRWAPDADDTLLTGTLRVS
jgi:hypothetical protein